MTLDGEVYAERLAYWPFTHEELDADLRAAGWCRRRARGRPTSTAIWSPRAQLELDAASALRIAFFRSGGSVALGTIHDARAINLERGGQILSGTIKVKLPNGGGFIDLGAAGRPSRVDATDGVIELSSAVQAEAKFASASARKVQRARFRDGIFTIRQGRRSALVTLVLSGPELRSCSRASASAKKKVRRLWGDGKGRFRTKDKFAAGTVRGTKWLTEDRCGSTRVKVTRGRVAVQDLVRKRTRVVRAGRSLAVRARR